MLTLLGAAGLFGAGWWMGSHAEQAPLAESASQAAAEASRANLLASEMDSLEKRLTLAQQALAACRAGGAKKPDSLETPLALGQAALLLNNQLVATLVSVNQRPPGAQIKLKVLGAQPAAARLNVGDVYSFQLKGSLYNLVLRRVGENQAVVSILK